MFSKILLFVLFVALFAGVSNLFFGNFELSYLVFFLVGVAFFYREYILTKKNKQLSLLQSRLLEYNKTLNERVKRATSDLENAQHLANVGSWIFNPRTNNLEWSRQAYKIFEISQEVRSDLFDLFLELVHPEDLEYVLSNYYSSLEDKKGREIKHRLLLKDGKVKYIIDKYEHRYDQNDRLIASYGIIQDITEHVLLEQELEKRDVDLMHKSRLAQMGEMLSMISHQWRQPLATISAKQIAIVTAIELEKYDLDEKNQRDQFLMFLRKNLDLIGEHLQNLSQIISNFSNFYQPHKDPKITSINEVIQNAFHMVKERFLSKDISVRLGLNSYLDVEVYDNEFMQVILNILFNAKEQCLEKKIQNPLIEVVSYDKDDFVYVEISDNGGGIDNAIMQKVFDPYVSTKLEKNGSGLGLYMSKSIIEKHHHGEIYANNTKEGAKFTIKLKRYKEI
ncbi:MAG: PAS domain-containing protein [Helicobacteraceae bacterium]|nr:PAS domain-containing protein [Helicobacteraceae bacterium]